MCEVNGWGVMAGNGEERTEGKLEKDKDDGGWGGDVGCCAGVEVSEWSVQSQWWS